MSKETEILHKILENDLIESKFPISFSNFSVIVRIHANLNALGFHRCFNVRHMQPTQTEVHKTDGNYLGNLFRMFSQWWK